MKKLLVLALALFAFTAPAPTTNLAAVKLAWDVHKDPTVNAYQVYYGPGPTASSWTNTVYVQGITNNSVSVSNLTRGTTWTFAVTAFNTMGLESGFSSSLNYFATPPPTPVTNVIITILIP